MRTRSAAGAKQTRDKGYTEEDVRRCVERSRAEQGLPPHVEDPATVERIVALLKPRGPS